MTGATGGRRTSARWALGVAWVVLLAGMPWLYRLVVRDPGEPVVPPGSALAGYAAGVLVGVAGFVWFLRRVTGPSATAPSADAAPTGVPWRVRRTIVRLGPVPAEYRDRVVGWLEGRRQVVRQLEPMLAWQFGLFVAVNAMLAFPWWAFAAFSVPLLVLYLLMGACVVAYRRRIERARRHFRDVATT